MLSDYSQARLVSGAMMRIEPAGAEALLLVLAEQPDADLAVRISVLAERIRARLGPVLVDLVPAWTSLLVHYDLLRSNHQQIVEQLTPLVDDWLQETLLAVPGPLLELPVYYVGADLHSVAAACQLSVAEVIAAHSGVQYRVGAIGFAPGFAYLGMLDARLVLPRHSTCRRAAWRLPSSKRRFTRRPHRAAGTCWASVRGRCLALPALRCVAWRWATECALWRSIRPRIALRAACYERFRGAASRAAKPGAGCRAAGLAAPWYITGRPSGYPCGGLG
jgi:hypothetical protein